MTLASCSWGTKIVPWDDFQYAFDKDGRCNVTIDSTKHHYILYTTEANFRHVQKGEAYTNREGYRLRKIIVSSRS